MLLFFKTLVLDCYLLKPCLGSQAKCYAGLRNLGSTCYANAVLQCLFHNRLFRSAIFQSGDVPDGAIKAMRSLFASMQEGSRAFAETVDLATALSLDHHVQQDGQEFLKASERAV